MLAAQSSLKHSSPSTTSQLPSRSPFSFFTVHLALACPQTFFAPVSAQNSRPGGLLGTQNPSPVETPPSPLATTFPVIGAITFAVGLLNVFVVEGFENDVGFVVVAPTPVPTPTMSPSTHEQSRRSIFSQSSSSVCAKQSLHLLTLQALTPKSPALVGIDPSIQTSLLKSPHAST